MAVIGGVVEMEDNSTVFKKPNILSIEEEHSQREINEKDSTNLFGGSGSSKSSSGKKGKVVVAKWFNVQRMNEVDDEVAEFFFFNGISFNATRPPQYKEMMKKVIVVGPSFQPPGYNKLRPTLLDIGVKKMQGVMEGLKKSWVEYGCSITMDSWTNIQQRPLLNIIITFPTGPYFLREIDCTGKRKDATFQYELLREAIEEIGPTN